MAWASNFEQRKGLSKKYVRKIFRKSNISKPLIRTLTFTYQVRNVRNVSFAENSAYVLNGWPLMQSQSLNNLKKFRRKKLAKLVKRQKVRFINLVKIKAIFSNKLYEKRRSTISKRSFPLMCLRKGNKFLQNQICISRIQTQMKLVELARCILTGLERQTAKALYSSLYYFLSSNIAVQDQKNQTEERA